MLDIRYIRENAKVVEEKAKQKGYKVDVKKLLALDEQRRELAGDIELIRAQRNELAHKAKAKKPAPAAVKKGQHLKMHLADCEAHLKPIEAEFEALLNDVPNIFQDDTPLGGETANKEEKIWGKAEAKGGKDHLTWAEERGLLDFQRGAKVAGNKFYFVRGALVELELSLLQLGLEMAKKHGFEPMLVPHLVNSRIIEGTGFAAKADERQIYKVEDEDLNLIATAEIPLTGYHADEILNDKDLPSLYAGYSPAYRLEAGAYGKHSKGLYRVHQFNKLELYVFCKPEDSEAWQQKLLQMEEEMCQKLELPYRIVRIATEELGAPAYKKYDVEYWSPADKAYRELMSCSSVTDYQARRLNIRYKDQDGQAQFVHTLNATLAAMSRLSVAIIENHQQKDGKVALPKALQAYMGGQKTI